MEESQQSAFMVASYMYVATSPYTSRCVQALRTIMQHLSLLLLLLIRLGGAHEAHNSNQQSLEVMTTDDHGDYDTLEEVDVESSNSAILNALMAFGINDTDIRPGQILCPPSNLSISYKKNRIVVGAVGCRLDPLISHYTMEQKRVLKGHHDVNNSLNCTDSINLAGYFPPVPGIIKCQACN